jgi:hypothetical protein
MSKKEEVFELPDKSDDAMDVPVPPKKKRVVSDEVKQKMLENLKKGREAKKAKAELAKAAKASEAPKEEPKVVQTPKEEPKVVEAPVKKQKATPKKVEPVIDLEAEKSRLALINKMIGKEKTKPVKRTEPVLSEATKEVMKSERKVKVIEEPKETPKETPKVVAPVAKVAPAPVSAPVPSVVHIVKSNYKKPIW